jgi:hypothetical protein
MEDHDTFKHIIDALSIGGVMATLAGWLPAIAALASLVWTVIRILETRTVQKWLS